MKAQNILLLSHGQLENYYLETIAEDVSCEFLYPVIIKESHQDLNEFYNPTRRQYDGNKLLKLFNNNSQDDILKTIGLFSVDLFIPILTYIFGQAIFKGKAGIVSTYRLRNEQYGMKADENLLFDRLRKLIIHELGHTFGLVHCYVPSCVMRSSTYVEELDQKKYRICSKCQEEIDIYKRCL